MIPAFGFGAQLPDGTVSQCFALNFNEAAPEVSGVSGLLAAYQNALSTVRLYGPPAALWCPQFSCLLHPSFSAPPFCFCPPFLIILVKASGPCASERASPHI